MIEIKLDYKIMIQLIHYRSTYVLEKSEVLKTVYSSLYK